MNKFFIDCGGYDGCSVRKFRDLYDPNLEYFIYSFEPNKMFNSYYEDLQKHSLINNAVYAYNGIANFHIDSIDHDGSSLFLKNNIFNKTITTVNTIDFSEWLNKLIKKHTPCEIILKLDIEGAEYKLLDRLIDTNLLKYIKILFIEWHYDRLLNIDHKEYKNIYEKINNYCIENNILIKEWDALEYKIYNAN